MTSSEPASGRRRKAATDGPPSLGRPEDDLLNTAQVAQLLHISTRTVLKLVADGTLPAHRLPGTRAFLFWRHEVLATIDAAVVKPGDVTGDDAKSMVTRAER